MSTIPNDLLYNASHEWVRDHDDGTVTVGITDHAQALLGDLVYIELPDEEAEFNAGDGIAVAESVKAASDIYAPLDGKVIRVNEAVLDDPELVNNDPYGDGWLFVLELDDPDMLAGLMSADQYAEAI